MPGFTAAACHGLAAAPASLYVNFRTASRWSAGILRRVMAGYVSKVQVRWLMCRSALSDALQQTRVDYMVLSQLHPAALSLPAHSFPVCQAQTAGHIGTYCDIFDAAQRGMADLVSHWQSASCCAPRACIRRTSCALPSRFHHPTLPYRFGSCSGRLPLHWASEYGHVHACRLLVDCRADVAARDRDAPSFAPQPPQTHALTHRPKLTRSLTALQVR
jgi:hypothetical protein